MYKRQAFIRERADRAAETYEKARLEGYPADGAQEQAMDTLLRGLRSVSYTHLITKLLPKLVGALTATLFPSNNFFNTCD